MPFDMFQNARRLLAQGKSAWVMIGNSDEEWNLIKLSEVPWKIRMRREETISRVGEYAARPTSPILEALRGGKE
jgi:hypothetical protein